jgi:NADPH2:quinone reductase
MRAIVYTEAGGSDVLKVVDRPIPAPGAGEVRVRVAVSGVNPTDWKAREGGAAFPESVPNQDGAGTIDAVGSGVDRPVGQRVWLWEAAWQRAEGTAQEFIVLPERQAVPLPAEASFDLGASLGIPALTAHRALTLSATNQLAPGALSGVNVLVAGGAGAVGNAAIQLARWAGANVVTTVSGPEKAALATAAGAHHVVNYRSADPAGAIKAAAPDGIDLVVELAPAANADLNRAVLGNDATIAIYGNHGGESLTVPVRPAMSANTRYAFLLVYTVPPAAKDQAVRDVSAAVAAGALRVGAAAGLPLHRFPLDRTAAAHDAVAGGATGKVLIDIG